jgi:nucleoside-diphosphate-sugar epimerase
VRLRDIAEAIGGKLGLPVRSLTPEEAPAQVGFVGVAAANDMPASSTATQQSLGWRATRPGLLAGLLGDYLV